MPLKISESICTIESACERKYVSAVAKSVPRPLKDWRRLNPELSAKRAEKVYTIIQCAITAEQEVWTKYEKVGKEVICLQKCHTQSNDHAAFSNICDRQKNNE